MMLTRLTFFSFLCMVMLSACNQKEKAFFEASNPAFHYSGRIHSAKKAMGLVGSAAFVEFMVQGDSVVLHIQSRFLPRNYVVVAINDQYQGRFKLEGDSIHAIALKLPSQTQSKISVYKATEAFNKEILFYGVEALSIAPVNENRVATIEFIGDSITCGALADANDIPCDAGEYLDQHNAYLAYGPRIARKLNTDFMLSSVSGIGMYRNWNDENEEEPIMPQVYGNVHLNEEDSTPYGFYVKPDVVSICLGTNDMSSGDRIKPRLPFNSEKDSHLHLMKVKVA